MLETEQSIKDDEASSSFNSDEPLNSKDIEPELIVKNEVAILKNSQPLVVPKQELPLDLYTLCATLFGIRFHLDCLPTSEDLKIVIRQKIDAKLIDIMVECFSPQYTQRKPGLDSRDASLIASTTPDFVPKWALPKDIVKELGFDKDSQSIVELFGGVISRLGSFPQRPIGNRSTAKSEVLLQVFFNKIISFKEVFLTCLSVLLYRQ